MLIPFLCVYRQSRNASQLLLTSHWASSPDNWILTSVAEVYGVWNLATNYHGAYFLSFLQTSSLLQAPIQAGLAPDCVEETLYFTNIYFLYANDWRTSAICRPTRRAIAIGGTTLSGYNIICFAPCNQADLRI